MRCRAATSMWNVIKSGKLDELDELLNLKKIQTTLCFDVRNLWWKVPLNWAVVFVLGDQKGWNFFRWTEQTFIYKIAKGFFWNHKQIPFEILSVFMFEDELLVFLSRISGAGIMDTSSFEQLSVWIGNCHFKLAIRLNW